ncbi:DUF5134 domain-containing protein [Actinacidiphila yeochonensis]|uniref:DUF5134 domain-containing protein n=1 Tax=Actinacidiphila yeochonensis TaxID=89050 RepID=UPI0005693C1A|nr:DUF5134 domain-containing protein [Actinacidiphila yeochonensis]
MHASPLVAWLLVALSTATSVSCLLRTGGRSEAAMGLGMAVMALPVLRSWPWLVLALCAVCAVSTAATVRAVLPVRPGGTVRGHRIHHVVGSAAMVYMAAAAAESARAASDRSGGMAMGGGVPLVTALLALYFAGFVLRSGARLVAVGPPTDLIPGAPAGTAPATGSVRAVPRLRNSPEVALACRVSMALGMLVMLLLM